MNIAKLSVQFSDRHTCRLKNLSRNDLNPVHTALTGTATVGDSESPFFHAIINGSPILASVMPMDKKSLFRQGVYGNHAIRPGTPVILLSGYNEPIEIEMARGLEIGGFVPRPFSMKNLGDMLWKVLKKKYVRKKGHFPPDTV